MNTQVHTRRRSRPEAVAVLAGSLVTHLPACSHPLLKPSESESCEPPMARSHRHCGACGCSATRRLSLDSQPPLHIRLGVDRHPCRHRPVEAGVTAMADVVAVPPRTQLRRYTLRNRR